MDGPQGNGMVHWPVAKPVMQAMGASESRAHFKAMRMRTIVVALGLVKLARLHESTPGHRCACRHPLRPSLSHYIVQSRARTKHQPTALKCSSQPVTCLDRAAGTNPVQRMKEIP